VFTGLIEGKGKNRRFVVKGRGARLTIECPFANLVLGESIAVSGVCLTVVEIEPGAFVADVSEETLARTTLGSLPVGGTVNLERALPAGGRLGGHIVSGHVDGIGTLVRTAAMGQATAMTFAFPKALARFIAEKGSIAVSGISLTVNRVDDETFDVAIIPHTANETTLPELAPGDTVNLEVDLLARYVERMLHVGARSGDATWTELLRKSGYL
jgi:riboflavin synthase